MCVFRSTEEIFALFVSVAFAVDAGKSIYKEFKYNYKSDYCAIADEIAKYGKNKGEGPYPYDESAYTTTAATTTTINLTLYNETNSSYAGTTCLTRSLRVTSQVLVQFWCVVDRW